MAEENQGNQGGGQTGSTGGASTSAATDRIDSSRTHARQAAEDLKSAATQMAGEYRGRANQAWEDAQTRARTLQDDGEQYVRENPTKAVFSALGIGFILGLLFRK
ncbi:MAG TPA: hypothetical protein VGC85_02015 [Chthoniobacterales bacterium]|jgi:ElaB/YqjD/DUF883 family membrane-anchored ribosome-binding protein